MSARVGNNRPVRILILLFALGIASCHWQASLIDPRWPAGAAALIALSGLLIRRRWPQLARLGVCACALLLGFSWADWRAGLRLAERLPAALEQQDLVVDGQVLDLPQRTAEGLRFLFQPGPGMAAKGLRGRFLLNWYADRETAPPPLHSGERWRLSLRLRRPHAAFNPPLADREALLFQRGISATGYVRASPAAVRLAPALRGPQARIDRWREAIRARFEAVLPAAPARGVLLALAIGDQAGIPEAQWDLFRRSGTIHLMSISGLHVTMIAALFAALTGFLWRRLPAAMLCLPAQQAALPAGMLAAGFYMLLAGAGTPAQRSFCMLFVASAMLLSGRAAGASRVMAVALLAVLLLDPWAVLSAGFWLSFGATGALLLVGKEVIRQGGRLRAWGLAWLKTQWAVTLVAIPLLLALVQQFSLVSPLANLLAVPLVSFVLTPLALLFAVLPVPFLAQLAEWLARGLIEFLQVLVASPASVWQQAAPPLWLVMAALSGALWALLPAGLPARRSGLLAFLPLLCYAPARPAEGEMRVSVLDVGQGLAVHVQTRSRDFLYDTGPQYLSVADAGQRIVLPWLRARGVTRLDELIVSHPDRDHSGGAASVLAGLPVGRWQSSLGADDGLRRAPVPHLACEAGLAREIDGLRFENLHPPAGWAGDHNERSCVLRIRSPHGSLLLTGDIGRRAEGRLLADARASLAADVLVVPHHGSKTSSTPAFLAAVGARHAVFTAGYLNRFGHPAAEVIARHEAIGSIVHRTDRDGALVFHFEAGGLRAERTRASGRRYWHDPE